MNTRKWMVIGAGLAVASAWLLSHPPTGSAAPTGSTLTTPAQPKEAIDQARGLSKAFQHAARVISPSVVHVTQKNRVLVRQSIFDRGRVQLRETGLGSGVIVRADGYILTNVHVIAGAEQLEVKLPDRAAPLPAQIVGVDAPTDLAVLKVDAEGLVAATFGDSDGLEVGEWVLAAGSPLGFDNTVTAGIVSATGRAGLASPTSEQIEEFIQTDAAINRGNSGGPLVNLDGHVVGINNQIATPSGGSVGLGFAIPSSIARPVTETLIRGERVDRGWLGVEWIDAGATGDGGMKVTNVLPDSPAERGGIQVGDVITRFNGRATNSGSRFKSAIAFTRPGENAPVEFLREGRPRTATVALIDRSTAQAAALGGRAFRDLGLILGALTAEEIGETGAPIDSGAVKVLQIDPGGSAAATALQEGDIIVAIDGNATPTLAAVDRALRTAVRTGVVRLNVVRGGTHPFTRETVWQRGFVDVPRR